MYTPLTFTERAVKSMKDLAENVGDVAGKAKDKVSDLWEKSEPARKKVGETTGAVLSSVALIAICGGYNVGAKVVSVVTQKEYVSLENILLTQITEATANVVKKNMDK